MASVLGILVISFVILAFVALVLLLRTKTIPVQTRMVNDFKVRISNRFTTSFGPFAGAAIMLPSRLPNMLMDSKRNNRMLYAKIGSKTGNDFKVVLEGNFSEHYDVYVREGNQDFALILLTPDVMEFFVQNDTYDLLIEGKLLYILRNDKTFLDLKDQEDLFMAAGAITSELERKLDRWQNLNSFSESSKKQIRQ